MSKFPQVHVVQKYQDFINKLSGVGKPSVVDQAYVRKLGFKSSYDANFLSAIKYIGLVEDKRNGAPTELWSRLRTDPKAALAEGLRHGYVDLFEFYPDAHLRDDEALANYFRGNSDEDADGVSRMVNAFTAVRDLAVFGDPSDAEASKTAGLDQEMPEALAGVAARKATGANVLDDRASKPTQVNINIQLQLPSDTSGEVYDRFFEAMKKHGLV